MIVVVKTNSKLTSNYLNTHFLFVFYFNYFEFIFTPVIYLERGNLDYLKSYQYTLFLQVITI